MFAGSVHILCHTSYNVWEKSFINLISHPKLVKKKQKLWEEKEIWKLRLFRGVMCELVRLRVFFETT